MEASMKVVKFVARVNGKKCNGDKRCEKLCPAGVSFVEQSSTTEYRERTPVRRYSSGRTRT